MAMVIPAKLQEIYFLPSPVAVDLRTQLADSFLGQTRLLAVVPHQFRIKYPMWLDCEEVHHDFARVERTGLRPKGWSVLSAASWSFESSPDPRADRA